MYKFLSFDLYDFNHNAHSLFPRGGGEMVVTITKSEELFIKFS